MADVDRYTRPEFAPAALVTIDVQRDVLDGGPLSFASPSALLSRIAQLVSAFRSAGRPIVHVVRLYLPNGSNVDPCRRVVIEQGAHVLLAGTSGSELASELLPERDVTLDADLLLSGHVQLVGPNEVVVYKPRWGAFYCTPLHEHLRSLEVTTLVVVGANFPNCPRATVYEASERDYRVVLVEDAVSRLYARGLNELCDIGIVVMAASDVVGCLSEVGAADRWRELTSDPLLPANSGDDRAL